MELITDMFTPFADGKTCRACTRDMGEVRQRMRWRAGERESGTAGGEREVEGQGGGMWLEDGFTQCVSVAVETTRWIYTQQGRRDRDSADREDVYWPSSGSQRRRLGAGHSGSNVKAFCWAPLRLRRHVRQPRCRLLLISTTMPPHNHHEHNPQRVCTAAAAAEGGKSARARVCDGRTPV